MDLVELEQVVRNVDARLTRIEQILPTLATKKDLKAHATKENLKAWTTKGDLKAYATKDDLKAFATKDDLRKAIEPLVTREEMHAALREEGQRTRTHFNAVAERLETKIQLIAEGQVALQERFEDLRKDVHGDVAQIDRRVTRLEASRVSGQPGTKPRR